MRPGERGVDVLANHFGQFKVASNLSPLFKLGSSSMTTTLPLSSGNALTWGSRAFHELLNQPGFV